MTDREFCKKCRLYEKYCSINNYTCLQSAKQWLKDHPKEEEWILL
jgi:hypothetical protein